ncbi:unnamed protein product [Tilletia controversa]|nr:unnamed protein product [Tilletia controversa]
MEAAAAPPWLYGTPAQPYHFLALLTLLPATTAVIASTAATITAPVAITAAATIAIVVIAATAAASCHSITAVYCPGSSRCSARNSK